MGPLAITACALNIGVIDAGVAAFAALSASACIQTTLHSPKFL